MPATLYAVPASHPCAAVERALQVKGLAYERVDLVPMTHPLVMTARFGARSVPGIRFEDGERVQGSRKIVRALEQRVPEPSLLGETADQHRAEEWGEQVLQPIGRRLIWAALKRAPGAAISYGEGARLAVPLPAVAQRLAMPVVARLETLMNGASDANARADLVALPHHLDRVEDWLETGALGGERLNAGDLQVASGLALLATIEDLAPVLDRPAGAYARRLFPDYPGRTPAGTLPASWLVS